jgi:hypothetical protein
MAERGRREGRGLEMKRSSFTLRWMKQGMPL